MQDHRKDAARDRATLNGRRFLVVDDQSYMVDVIAEILKHFGAEDTARAESIEAAARCIGPHAAFDVVICDFNMKPTNGLQFLQAIRAGKHRGTSASSCSPAMARWMWSGPRRRST